MEVRGSGVFIVGVLSPVRELCTWRRGDGVGVPPEAGDVGAFGCFFSTFFVRMWSYLAVTSRATTRGKMVVVIRVVIGVLGCLCRVL